MKTIMTLLFACIFYAANAQNSLTKKIAIKESYYSGDLVKASNGDIIFSQRITPNSGVNGNDVYCIRINQQGQTIWEKIFSTPANERNSKLLALSDNGFVIFTNPYNYTDKKYGGLIIKCDSAGNVVWSRKFRGRQNAFDITPVKIIEDKEGNITCVYDLNNPFDITATSVHMIKFSSSGNFLAYTGLRNIYNAREGQNYYTRDIIQLADNGFAIAAVYESCADCSLGSEAYLIVLDEKGKVISYNETEPMRTNPNEYDAPYRLFEKDGNLFVLGYHFSWVNPPDSDWFYWARYNKNGSSGRITLIPYNAFALQKFLRENNIVVSNRGQNEFFFANLYDKQYNLINYTYLPLGTTRTDTVIINRFDSLGRICPTYTEPQFSYDTFSRAPYKRPAGGIKRYDDTFRISAQPIIVSDTTIAWDECTGKAPQFALKSILSRDQLSRVAAPATLFPNPATASTTVSFCCDRPGMGCIYITSAEGNAMQTIKINTQRGNNLQTLNVSALAGGIYFVKILSEGKYTTLKFLKK